MLNKQAQDVIYVLDHMLGQTNIFHIAVGLLGVYNPVTNKSMLLPRSGSEHLPKRTGLCAP